MGSPKLTTTKAGLRGILPRPSSSTAETMNGKGRSGVQIMQDAQSCVPLSNLLKSGDIILLLTPGIIPEASPLNRGSNDPPSDPFEPLGKALAWHHPWVRHVPYLPRNGITGTHVVHIRLAAVVIFVISGPPRHGQPSQVPLAEITRTLCEDRTQIILTCCDVQDLGQLDESFPTIIEVPSLAPSDLEAVADLIMGDSRSRSSREPVIQKSLAASPATWSVEVWDANRDISEVLDLWCQCFPETFHLGRYRFESLLRRDGYAMHYVVREPASSRVLGFCGTYTTYADSGGERLLGSLAILLVRPSSRQRGIGSSLHDHALRQLRKTRGVCRLQLGSTFPRLLYGVPLDSPSEEWFQRRGWPIKPLSTAPGSGEEVCDWFLKFKDWPATRPLPSDVVFRSCDFAEFDTVLEFVGKISKEGIHMGWYDQYAKLANTMNIRDIVIGLEGNTIVAAALTYVKNTGNPVVEDLPWAGAIADDVGGVTCICIRDEALSVASRRDAVMVRLLDTCIRLLADQGMEKLFVDAIQGGDEGLRSMGFRKWASYRNVWQDV